MKNWPIILIAFFLISFISCSDRVIIEKLKFYDPAYKLPDNSGLRTDGYYEIESNFRTFIKYPDSFYTQITYGFIQFFDDGFCRIGYWNGIFEDKEQVKHVATQDTVWGWRWGLYKLKNDTLVIEYTVKKMESFSKTAFYRAELTALMKIDSIFIIEDSPFLYTYPPEKNRSAQTCIGRFVEAKIDTSKFNNFLKQNPDKFLENNLNRK